MYGAVRTESFQPEVRGGWLDASGTGSYRLSLPITTEHTERTEPTHWDSSVASVISVVDIET
jgi:hypothetical protein